MGLKKTAGSASNQKGCDTYGPKYGDCEEGQVLAVGVLFRIGQDSYKNPRYDFKLEDGTTIGLNHCQGFEEAIEGIGVGTLCVVTYAGFNIIKTGPQKGKKFHRFDIEYEEETLVKAEAVEETEEEVDEAPEPTPIKTKTTPKRGLGGKKSTVAKKAAEEETPVAESASSEDLLAKYRRREG